MCGCPLFKLALKTTVKHFFCQLCCFRSVSYPSCLFASPLLTLHDPISTGHMLGPKARPFARLEHVPAAVRETGDWGKKILIWGSTIQMISISLNDSVFSLAHCLHFLMAKKINCVVHPSCVFQLMSLRNFTQSDDLICNLVSNVCRSY